MRHPSFVLPTTRRRRAAAALLIATFAGGYACDAVAAVAFGAPVETDMYYDRAVGDGTGNWLRANADQISHSTDGGTTWSAPEPTPTAGLGCSIMLSYLGAGSWLAATYDPSVGIVTSRSTDIGVTWSPLVTAFAYPGAGCTAGVRDIHAAGTTVDLLIVRIGDLSIVAESNDGGVSWTSSRTIAATPFGISAANFASTDWNGTWIAIDDSTDTLGGTVGSDSDILYSISTDDGVSWSPPAALNSNAATDSGNDEIIGAPRPVFDGVGTWLVVWRSGDTLGGTLGSDWDLLVARSSDAGATWSDPAPLNADAARSDDYEGPVEAVLTDGAGTWLVVWHVTPQSGVSLRAFTQSTDGGVRWSPVTWLNGPGPLTPESWSLQAVAVDAGGNWAISLRETFGLPAVKTQTFSSPVCPSVPATGCIAGASAGKSKLSMASEGKFGWNTIKWKFVGDPLPLGDITDPTVSTGFALCLYDYQSGTPLLVSAHHARGAGTCGTRPCWKATSKGYKYKDGDGPVPRMDVLTTASKSKLLIRGRRANVLLPPLPPSQDPKITAQLVDPGTGVCWTTDFSNAMKSGPTQFRARSD